MLFLSDVLLDAVRIGLSACVADRPRRHPDSSRQRKAVLQAKERREARRMKSQRNTWIPELPATGRWRNGVQYFSPREYYERKAMEFGLAYGISLTGKQWGQQTGRWTSKTPNFVEVEKSTRSFIERQMDLAERLDRVRRVGGGNGRTR